MSQKRTLEKSIKDALRQILWRWSQHSKDSICKEWRDDYKSFVQWGVDNGFILKKKRVIRKEGEKLYSPKTCIIVDNDSKESKSSSKMGAPVRYWGSRMDDIFVQYNKLTDPEERNTLYELEIKAPIEKLVQCIFNTFKFEYVPENPENSQRDCVAFLMTHCKNYQPSKGKSYSYFSLIAKNYFIQLNKKWYELRCSTIPLLLSTSKSDTHLKIGDKIANRYAWGIGNEYVIGDDIDGSAQLTSEFYKHFIEYLKVNSSRLFGKKEKRQKIGETIIKVLEYAPDNLDSLNKLVIFREIKKVCGMGSYQQHITRCMTILRQHYVRLRQRWDNGIINTDFINLTE